MDYRPSRLACLASTAERFIRLFFDANPLSHLAVVVLREGVARQVTELTASPDTHVAAVKANMTAAGQASLQASEWGREGGREGEVSGWVSALVYE